MGLHFIMLRKKKKKLLLTMFLNGEVLMLLMQINKYPQSKLNQEPKRKCKQQYNQHTNRNAKDSSNISNFFRMVIC